MSERASARAHALERACVPVWLPACVPTYLPTYLPACLLACLPACLNWGQRIITPDEAQLMILSDSSVLLSHASFCNIYIA